MSTSISAPAMRSNGIVYNSLSMPIRKRVRETGAMVNAAQALGQGLIRQNPMSVSHTHPQPRSEANSHSSFVSARSNFSTTCSVPEIEVIPTPLANPNAPGSAPSPKLTDDFADAYMGYLHENCKTFSSADRLQAAHLRLLKVLITESPGNRLAHNALSSLKRSIDGSGWFKNAWFPKGAFGGFTALAAHVKNHEPNLTCKVTYSSGFVRSYSLSNKDHLKRLFDRLLVKTADPEGNEGAKFVLSVSSN